MNNKRYFRVKGIGDGGEFVMGQVTKEFIEYWQGKDEDEIEISIRDHLDGSKIDPDSPKPTDSKYQFDSWHEYDDIEHIYGLSAKDSGLFVEEVKPAEGTQFKEDGELVWINSDSHGESGDLWIIIKEAEWHKYGRPVYFREIYLDKDERRRTEQDNIIPVIVFFNLEKGYFWDTIVETDGEDFDIDRFQLGLVETKYSELVEQCWYDRKPLYLNGDCRETRGKADYEFVGWLNKTEYDKVDHPDHFFDLDGGETEEVRERFEELYEEYEDEKNME